MYKESLEPKNKTQTSKKQDTKRAKDLNAPSKTT